MIVPVNSCQLVTDWQLTETVQIITSYNIWNDFMDYLESWLPMQVTTNISRFSFFNCAAHLILTLFCLNSRFPPVFLFIEIYLIICSKIGNLSWIQVGQGDGRDWMDWVGEKWWRGGRLYSYIPWLPKQHLVIETLLKVSMQWFHILRGV